MTLWRKFHPTESTVLFCFFSVSRESRTKLVYKINNIEGPSYVILSVPVFLRPVWSSSIKETSLPLSFNQYRCMEFVICVQDTDWLVYILYILSYLYCLLGYQIWKLPSMIGLEQRKKLFFYRLVPLWRKPLYSWWLFSIKDRNCFINFLTSYKVAVRSLPYVHRHECQHGHKIYGDIGL